MEDNYLVITEKRQNPNSSTFDEFEQEFTSLEAANAAALTAWNDLTDHDKQRQHIYVCWAEGSDRNTHPFCFDSRKEK